MTTPASKDHPKARLAFIGGGNMASAILGGLMRPGSAPTQVTVIEPFAEMLIGAGFDFEKIVNFDVNSLVYMQSFFTRNLNIMLIMVMFINSAVLLFAYIYFGLIGKKLSGSPGKYIFHIGVEANDGKNSSLKLLKREPIIHFLILGFISSIVSVLFGFVFPMFIVTIVYIHLMLTNRDFWNNDFSFFSFN